MSTVLTTGVSPGGIGAATAKAIASCQPAMLILASRTEAKLTIVSDGIRKDNPGVDVRQLILDLSSIESIRAAAATIDLFTTHIDVLINNAGASMMTRQPVKTPGGTVVDLQFFTNHLGPFLFTALLLSKLVAAGTTKPSGARIINLTSHGHRLSPVRFSDYAFLKDTYDGVPEAEVPARTMPPTFRKEIDGYPGFIAYGQSKSANVLHARELARRLHAAKTNVLAFSVHPGTIETELSRELDQEGLDGIAKTSQGFWKTLDQGAATTIVAAFDPLLAKTVDVPGGKTVGYFSDCQLMDDFPAPWTRGWPNAKQLWDESERMLGVSARL